VVACLSRHSKTQHLTLLASLLAVSVVLSYIESLIPVPIPIPGIKYGLANTLGLILLALFNKKDYVFLSILRVIIMGLLRNGFSTTFLISLSGMSVSILAVLYCNFVTDASIYGLSLVSAIFHGVGQILMVAFLYSEPAMISYLPVMLLTGMISGLLIAFLSKKIIVSLSPLIKRLSK
jgi:heptaprenyl diphosphate synthase